MGTVMKAATNAAGLAKAASLRSRAFVTFLAGNGDYVKGVIGLAKGLRKVRTAYPLVVAALPDVPEEHRRMLVEQGCIVREIEPVYPPENKTQFAMAYYVINYSKLRIWEFVEYHKMIYLDGDIQGSKPWRYTGKEEHMEREDIKMLVKKWWDIYNDDSLDYRSRAESEIEKRMAALSKAGAVKHVRAPSAA
ncbi:unnamed protein product [Thlaspi arvense]|uniref:Hexosyltransferase n=1 Tax=Thlaspi arvense TaxID=13288 RepID=A0AAU9RG77_THLAR|nr:unnamed protein product [Thlaspi arvense]